MDISERRKPQDGRITVKAGTRIVDMRVSSMPTLSGEKIVMRILDKTASIRKLGAQRQGTGRLLLGGVLAAARAEHVRHIYLEVRESNAPAIALYEHAGFRQCGVRRRYYREPVEDAKVLRLDVISG